MAQLHGNQDFAEDFQVVKHTSGARVRICLVCDEGDLDKTKVLQTTIDVTWKPPVYLLQPSLFHQF